MSNSAAATDYAKLLEGAETDVANRDAGRTPPPLIRVIEALLFAGDRPLTPTLAAAAIRGLTPEQLTTSVDQLNGLYRRQCRPYSIQLRPDGFKLALKSEFNSLREQMVCSPREAKLTVPMLDVLSVVAYKQPVTRNEIDALRGSESNAILRQLVRLSLVSVQQPLPGGTESAYNTTQRFLEVFGLRSLDDLPRTADLQKI